MSTSERILEYLSKHPSSDSDQIVKDLKISKSTLYKYLRPLIDEGKVIKTGQPPGEVYYSLKDSSPGKKPEGPSVSTDRTSTKVSLTGEDPPLVHLEVTNPITYLKLWWKKIIGNEGMSIKFSVKIKPLTAIAIGIIFLSFGFGIGRLTILEKTPVAKYLPSPTPTPSPWRETAYSGLVRYTDFNDTYYLVTNSAEAIRLQLPDNVDLSPFVNSRIFATGNYHKTQNVLEVTHASDLELLPAQIESVPTVPPTPTLTPSPTPTIETE